MSLPPVPERETYDDGYDWIERLIGTGWHVVPAWGSDGWDLGQWPYVIMAHHNGDTFGLVVYVEGDLEVEEFETREARDKATSHKAIFYWQLRDVRGAPRNIKDPRLGPYRP